jgi:hypothetical protein
MTAALVTSADAAAPWMPTTARPATSASAVATLAPVAWTFTPLELETEPVSEACVAPETVAVGTMIETETPPPPPPGVFAVALLAEFAVTETAPVVPTAAPSVALVVRPLVALATVAPRARPPTATLSASAVATWVPPACTLAPSAPSVAVPPALACVEPEIVASATAALSAAAPPWSEYAFACAPSVSVAETLRPATGPGWPIVTEPTVAEVSPERLEIVIEAPAATAPPAMPSVLVSTSRVAAARTTRSWPLVTAVPSPIEAVWVPVELITATWPPTATKPPPAPNAKPSVSSPSVAETTMSPVVPAVIVAPVPIVAWTSASRLATSTEPPTATKPPWMPPTMPLKSSCSSAATLMAPPAITVAPSPICAAVPPEGGAETAAAKEPASGAPPAIAPLAEPAADAMRVSVALPEPVEMPLRIDCQPPLALAPEACAPASACGEVEPFFSASSELCPHTPVLAPLCSVGFVAALEVWSLLAA